MIANRHQMEGEIGKNSTGTIFADILYKQLTDTIEKQNFDVAYNQGKSLDLETVVRELLTEFGAEGHDSQSLSYRQ